MLDAMPKVFIRLSGTTVTTIPDIPAHIYKNLQGSYYCFFIKDKLASNLTNVAIKAIYNEEKSFWNTKKEKKPTMLFFCEEDNSIYCNAAGLFSQYGSAFGDLNTPNTAEHPDGLFLGKLSLQSDKPNRGIGNLQLINDSGTTVYAVWQDSNQISLNYNFADNLRNYQDGGYKFDNDAYYVIRRSGEKLACIMGDLSAVQKDRSTKKSPSGNVKDMYVVDALQQIQASMDVNSLEFIPTKTITEPVDNLQSANLHTITVSSSDLLAHINSNYRKNALVTASTSISIGNMLKYAGLGYINNSLNNSLSTLANQATYIPYSENANDLFGLAHDKNSCCFFCDIINIQGEILRDSTNKEKVVLSQSQIFNIFSCSEERLPLGNHTNPMNGSFMLLDSNLPDKTYLKSRNKLQVLCGVRLSNGNFKYTVLPAKIRRFLFNKQSAYPEHPAGFAQAFAYFNTSVYERAYSKTHSATLLHTFLTIDVLDLLKDLKLDASFTFLHESPAFNMGYYDTISNTREASRTGLSYFSSSRNELIFHRVVGSNSAFKSGYINFALLGQSHTISPAQQNTATYQMKAPLSKIPGNVFSLTSISEEKFLVPVIYRADVGGSYFHYVLVYPSSEQ